MIEAGIFDGDYALIRRADTARDGDIGVDDLADVTEEHVLVAILGDGAVGIVRVGTARVVCDVGVAREVLGPRRAWGRLR